jgi:chemotaxis protein CheX
LPIADPSRRIRAKQGRENEPVNADVVNAFLGATLNVMETMALTRARAGDVATTSRGASGGVTGLCGLAGEAWSGVVAVRFTAPAILTIGSSMRGESVSAIDDALRATVADLTVQIADRARKELAGRGYRFSLALPAVVAGADPDLSLGTSAPAIVLPFATDGGEFTVEIRLGK